MKWRSKPAQSLIAVMSYILSHNVTAHWHQLLNTTQRSVCAADSALCQITLMVDNLLVFNDCWK